MGQRNTITNEIYGGYDTERGEIRTQGTKMVLRRGRVHVGMIVGSAPSSGVPPEEG